jgi:hypothetical protein
MVIKKMVSILRALKNYTSKKAYEFLSSAMPPKS